MGIEGQRLGNIRIGQLLARGGMGELYSGYDEALKRKVAVKTIRGRLASRPEKRQRFLREARILSRLDHPHICRIHEYVIEDDLDFLILEWIPGKDLERTLFTDLDFDHKLQIGQQVLKALEVAHGLGVVHRDLKPANVMLTDAGTVKVLDFGVAGLVGPDLTSDEASDEFSAEFSGESSVSRTFPLLADEEEDLGTFDPTTTITERLTQAMTDDGYLIGTPGYMSPEQALGQEVTAASDIFSAGLLLQELFTGDSAYEKTDRLDEVFRQTIEVRTVPMSGLDNSLTQLIQRMTSRHPAERPSAGAAASSLQRIADRPRRRRRRFLIAAALLLLFLGGLKYTLDLRWERSKALAAQAESDQVVEFLVDLFASSDPNRSLGRTVTAEELLERGAEKLRQELDDQPLVRARLLDTIGDVYYELGRLDDAETLVGEGLDVRRQFAAEPQAMLMSLWHLASIHRRKERYPQAEELLDEAIALGAAHAVPEIELAGVLNERALVHEELGQNAEAIALHERILAVRERELGAKDQLVATSLNNLGLAFSKSGQHEKGESLMLRALEIRELLDPDHPELATTRNNLAGIYYLTGRYSQALPLLLADAASTERVLGPDHPDLAISLNNLGVIHRMLERYTESLDYFQKAEAIALRLHGEEHPDFAEHLSNRAAVLNKLGRLEDSEALIRQSLKVIEAHHGAGHPSAIPSWSRLGMVLASHGDLESSLEAMNQAIESARARLNTDHPWWFERHIDLAWLYLLTGDVERARESFEPVRVELDEFDDGHRLRQQMHGMLARLEFMEGDLVKARRHLESRIRAIEDRFDLSYASLAGPLLNMARIDVLDGKLDDARTRIEAIVEALQGRLEAGEGSFPHRRLLAEAHWRHGLVMASMGDEAESRASLERALKQNTELLRESSMIELRYLQTKILLSLDRSEDAEAVVKTIGQSAYRDSEWAAMVR